MPQIPTISFYLSTMCVENFENYLPQIAKIGFKVSTMSGGNFENYLPQMAENGFKLSTTVGENLPREQCRDGEVFLPPLPNIIKISKMTFATIPKSFAFSFLSISCNPLMLLGIV